jgi:hypothetical protein
MKQIAPEVAIVSVVSISFVIIPSLFWGEILDKEKGEFFCYSLDFSSLFSYFLCFVSHYSLIPIVPVMSWIIFWNLNLTFKLPFEEPPIRNRNNLAQSHSLFVSADWQL